jgi:hypothetical protein
MRNRCISLVLLEQYITMHGPLNVKPSSTSADPPLPISALNVDVFTRSNTHESSNNIRTSNFLKHNTKSVTTTTFRTPLQFTQRHYIRVNLKATTYDKLDRIDRVALQDSLLLRRLSPKGPMKKKEMLWQRLKPRISRSVRLGQYSLSLDKIKMYTYTSRKPNAKWRDASSKAKQSPNRRDMNHGQIPRTASTIKQRNSVNFLRRLQFKQQTETRSFILFTSSELFYCIPAQ